MSDRNRLAVDRPFRMTSSLHGKVHRLIAAFAHRIAPVYQQLDWRWGEDDAAPTEAQIALSLCRMVGECSERIGDAAQCQIASGGLAVVIEWDCGEWEIQVGFDDTAAITESSEDARWQ